MKEHQAAFASAGRDYSGLLVEPDVSAPRSRAGVLVLHGGAGLGAHERERARILAELGVVAFAPDLFGEAFTSREPGIAVITGLVREPARLRARLADALTFLSAHPSVDPSRLGAIGYCFGGLAALELARSGARVRAVVSFHGGLTTTAPAQPGVVSASILVCTGAADPFVTREHRASFEEEMTNADADWQMHVYAKAMHGFTERPADGRPERPGQAYDESADQRSWAAMRALLNERLAFA